MKFLLLITLSCVIALTWGRPGSTYTDKWDNINLDDIIDNPRLQNSYADCLLDKGRCTPDAKELKETLPDALGNECANCTKKQKEGSDKVIRHLVNKRPELWKELAVKYDPENIYQQRYKDKLDAVKEN